ncbi:MAG: LPXTG cell wall anchor domain-containing protein, partial [Erysipelotrichaceae bacterium]|nr:LPXTG cell wall anchor domain-containing protein [Erysipelotrichaceae bacterium]
SGEAPVILGGTDSNGILLLGGLEENTKYYLFETKAAPGYNMLTAPVIITTTGPNTINASLVNTPLKCEKVKDDNNNDVWEITVYNSAGVELPHTGGIGTTIFRMAGLTLILAAGIVLIFKKRH